MKNVHGPRSINCFTYVLGGWCVFSHLEVVVRLEFVAHSAQLLVVRALDLAQSRAHLVLPELAVFGGGVAVGQSRQLLHFLLTKKKFELKQVEG